MASAHHHHQRFALPTKDDRRLPSLKDLNFSYSSPDDLNRHNWSQRSQHQQHTPPLSAGPTDFQNNNNDNSSYAIAQAIPPSVNVLPRSADDPPIPKRQKTTSRDVRTSHQQPAYSYPPPSYASPSSVYQQQQHHHQLPSGLSGPPAPQDLPPQNIPAYPSYPQQQQQQQQYIPIRPPAIQQSSQPQPAHSNPYPSPGPPPSAPPPQGPWGQPPPQHPHPHHQPSSQPPPPPPPQPPQHQQHSSQIPSQQPSSHHQLPPSAQHPPPQHVQQQHQPPPVSISSAPSHIVSQLHSNPQPPPSYPSTSQHNQQPYQQHQPQPPPPPQHHQQQQQQQHQHQQQHHQQQQQQQQQQQHTPHQPHPQPQQLIHQHQQQQQQQQQQPQQHQPQPPPQPPSSFSRTTAIVPTTLDARIPYAPQEPERVSSVRGDTVGEIATHCTVLYNFASHWAQTQASMPHLQPSVNELEEMSQRAVTVVRLLEELNRLHFPVETEQTRVLSDAMQQSPDDSRPPKRPWEDVAQDDTAPIADPNVYNEQQQPYSTAETKPQTTAEEDMELIRTKRAASTAGANGTTGQPKSKYRKRSRATPPGKCHSCNIKETPEWRRGPDGARTLCNACGLHYAKLMRKRDKAGPNGETPHIDLETLRASARAADLADKTGSRAKQRTHPSEPTSPMDTGKQIPQHHQSSFQVVQMMPQETQQQQQQQQQPQQGGSGQVTTTVVGGPAQQTQHQSMPPPASTTPWAATRAYPSDHLQSFMRTSQQPSTTNHTSSR